MNSLDNQYQKQHPSVISENGDELLFDKEGNLIKVHPKQNDVMKDDIERLSEEYSSKETKKMTNEKREQETQSEIAGYIHYYLCEGQLKSQIIPKEIKEDFLKKFGHDLIHSNENEINNFIENWKQKNEQSR